MSSYLSGDLILIHSQLPQFLVISNSTHQLGLPDAIPPTLGVRALACSFFDSCEVSQSTESEVSCSLLASWPRMAAAPSGIRLVFSRWQGQHLDSCTIRRLLISIFKIWCTLSHCLYLRGLQFRQYPFFSDSLHLHIQHKTFILIYSLLASHFLI